MKALTYTFWAFVIIIAGLMFALTRLLGTPGTSLSEPQPLSDTCPETMVCYEPYGSSVEPEYILAGTIVQVKFVSADELPDGFEAYAQWEVDTDKNISWCIITTTLPKQVLGDAAMDALGHELLHCITGQFHT